ncbi:hypothetical protein CORT_0F01310 [Candida orthopsilosis Co 90-125]|uniref:Uncharacterized protein n=1 Tax=Candida orthopsilosis (strain 90-125) TaxID=1136231 RepID=H8X960_CANO9|nr:hypothetical protein CORT_0F01310 [Candida orthopsilosis Co 90-125]CCG24359.1 hypothetical protein CORT_0F01310 [Candida orthopsilosis Co 90-125]
MLIRRCLSKNPTFVPIRAFVSSPLWHNVLESNLLQTTSTIDKEVPTKKSKRIFLKPDQIKNRKKRNNGKWTHSTSRQSRTVPKVDLALIQELYRKNNNLSNSSTDEDGDLFRYIETFKPLESKIGSKRYEKLAKEVYNAFKKNQIVNYINYYRSKNPDLPPLKTRQNKSQIIEALFTQYWKITEQESKLSNEELLSSRVIELTPAQRFLLDPKRSKFIHNLIASNIKVQLGKTKLSISGLDSELDYIEAELVQMNNQIKWEEIDLSSIKNGQKTALDFDEISIASSSYFKDLGDGKFKIMSNTQADIDTAKRLILWALDYNPHIQTLFFNKQAIEGAQLLPYINEDVWPWSDKHAQYYSLFYKDRKPGIDSDLVFEKFDKMNDKILKLESLEELVDQRLALKSDKDSFIDEAMSDELLDIFKYIGTGKKEPVGGHKLTDPRDISLQSTKETESNENSQKKFDLEKIIKNRKESATSTNNHEQHLNLEALRHQLGNFEEDLNLEDFPDVSNLIVDMDKQTSDEVLELLRTELGVFAENDGSEFIEDASGPLDSVEGPQQTHKSSDNSVIAPANSSSDDQVSSVQLVKQTPLSDEQIGDLYSHLNDLLFAKGLQGASREVEPYSAYTIQFGSLLLKQNKDSLSEPDPSHLSRARPDQFRFLTSIPFIKDLATSLPILYNGNQTFTNKMQIRLVPSIYQNFNSLDPQTLQDYPPIEIQADLNDWGKIKLETLQVLSVEAMNNIYVAAPQLALDLQVSKLIIGDLLQPQMKEHKQNGISFDNQPNLSKFLENSQLSFGGQVKIKPSSSIELCVNGKFIKYDFVHLTYKTDLMFDLNGRELCLSIIEGGAFGGKRFEIMLGDGELSKDEFAKFFRDAVQFCSKI